MYPRTVTITELNGSFRETTILIWFQTVHHTTSWKASRCGCQAAKRKCAVSYPDLSERTYLSTHIHTEEPERIYVQDLRMISKLSPSHECLCPAEDSKCGAVERGTVAKKGLKGKKNECWLMYYTISSHLPNSFVKRALTSKHSTWENAEG